MLFYYFIFIYFVSVCMHGCIVCSCVYVGMYYVRALCVCVCAVACMWISEDSLWAFCPVGPRDQTQAVMLGSKYLYSQSSHWAQEDTAF